MTPSEIADRLVDHAYEHVTKGEFDGNDQTYGKDLGISNRSDLKDHIENTLDDPNTIGFIKKDGREQYYNEETNTFIAIDGDNKGTCFRPVAHKEYFDQQFREDVRKGAEDNPDRIKPGGYAGLESERQLRDGVTEPDNDQGQGQGGPSGGAPSTPPASEQPPPAQDANEASAADAKPARRLPPPAPPPPQAEESYADSNTQGRGR